MQLSVLNTFPVTWGRKQQYAGIIIKRKQEDNSMKEAKHCHVHDFYWLNIYIYIYTYLQKLNPNSLHIHLVIGVYVRAEIRNKIGSESIDEHEAALGKIRSAVKTTNSNTTAMGKRYIYTKWHFLALPIYPFITDNILFIIEGKTEIDLGPEFRNTKFNMLWSYPSA